MKSLPLHSQHYRYLLKSYQEYLQILGYATVTIQSWPVHVKEFLHFLEKKNVKHITVLESKDILDFITHIKRRANKRAKGMALSSSSINKIINAVNVFIKFLNSTGKYIVETTALTVTEIKALYEATFMSHRQNPIAMGQRDRAIIAVFYGCGLRRTEGIQLQVTDIDLQKKLLFVRNGKGGKQRYVPIAAKHLQDIKDYLREGREWFLYSHDDGEMKRSRIHGTPLGKKSSDNEAAFFMSVFGKRMRYFEPRLKQLKNQAEITKHITLHGLRHSIATHLLQSGMDIEEIAKFLGHSSLASTQIYTHIINQL